MIVSIHTLSSYRNFLPLLLRGSARWTPNSKYILCGTLDSILRIWDMAAETGPSVIKEYPNEMRRSGCGYTNTKYCLATSFLSNTQIVTGSENNSIFAFNVKSKEFSELSSQPQHTGQILGSILIIQPNFFVYLLQTK